MQTFKSYGKIIYDPPRGQMKKRTSWWAIVDVDPEITRYYRWWVGRRYGIHLCKPSWDAHISIVRGEEPKDKSLWGKYAQQIIEFEVSPVVRQSGDTTGGDRPDHYWFVEIYCLQLMRIRQEMDLITTFKNHLTVGRTY